MSAVKVYLFSYKGYLSFWVLSPGVTSALLSSRAFLIHSLIRHQILRGLFLLVALCPKFF
jgi:hypothetical protein